MVIGVAAGLGLSTNPVLADVTSGITYGASGQKLDLCRAQGKARRTALVFIHGGGFVAGDRSQMLGYCRLLAKGGFMAVTVSYRLASAGHSYPSAADDIRAAVAWIRQQSASLPIDPDKIVLIGYSAGGTLAMTVGLDDRSGVAGVVSVAGISDFDALLEGAVLPRLKADSRTYLGAASPADASPLTMATSNDPAVFLFHAKDDRIVPVAQSVAIARRLESVGAKALLRVFPDGGHGILGPNPHLNQLLTELTRFLVAIDAQ